MAGPVGSHCAFWFNVPATRGHKSGEFSAWYYPSSTLAMTTLYTTSHSEGLNDYP